MNEIEKAIEHFHYGITHDIFSEPVTTYARLAIDALREKAEREKGGRTMNELKPCPFCGGESLLRELYIIGVAKTKHYIRECRHCKATFAHRFRSIKKANEAWNRRADAVPVVRGEWVVDECDTTDDVPSSSWIDFHCSECNTDYGLEEGQYGWCRYEKIPYQYCPNCGAKMEVEHGE